MMEVRYATPLFRLSDLFLVCGLVALIIAIILGSEERRGEIDRSERDRLQMHRKLELLIELTSQNHHATQSP